MKENNKDEMNVEMFLEMFQLLRDDVHNISSELDILVKKMNQFHTDSRRTNALLASIDVNLFVANLVRLLDDGLISEDYFREEIRNGSSIKLLFDGGEEPNEK